MMDIHTVVVRIENGHFAGLDCLGTTVQRVAVVTDGVEERVTVARQLVSEHDIAEAVRVVAACQRMGEWHGLDSAGGLVSLAAAEASDACASLADAYAAYDTKVNTSTVFGDLEALLADGVRTHALRVEARRAAQRLFDAIDGLEDAYAAVGGDHQMPLTNSKEGDDEHVRH